MRGMATFSGHVLIDERSIPTPHRAVPQIPKKLKGGL
jgi:hypothetical protein